MKYIDPHIHMVSRTTDDYMRMALAGCVCITEPAFWNGFDRGSVDGFRDYFLQLTQYEPKRAANYGIEYYSWICINPKEADDPAFAREVIAIIPEFLEAHCVVGVGEIVIDGLGFVAIFRDGHLARARFIHALAGVAPGRLGVRGSRFGAVLARTDERKQDGGE